MLAPLSVEVVEKEGSPVPELVKDEVREGNPERVCDEDAVDEAVAASPGEGDACAEKVSSCGVLENAAELESDGVTDGDAAPLALTDCVRKGEGDVQGGAVALPVGARAVGVPPPLLLGVTVGKPDADGAPSEGVGSTVLEVDAEPLPLPGAREGDATVDALSQPLGEGVGVAAPREGVGADENVLLGVEDVQPDALPAPVDGEGKNEGEGVADRVGTLEAEGWGEPDTDRVEQPVPLGVPDAHWEALPNDDSVLQAVAVGE